MALPPIAIKPVTYEEYCDAILQLNNLRLLGDDGIPIPLTGSFLYSMSVIKLYEIQRNSNLS